MDDIQLGARAQSHAGWPLPANSLHRTGSWCPVKTAEGQAEIRQRHRRLTQRQRTMLLLVDGRRSAEQVKALALQAGATDTAFDELLDLGLIAAPSTETPISEAPDAGLAVASTPDPVSELTASDAAPHETSSPANDPVYSAPSVDLEPAAAVQAAQASGAVDSAIRSDAGLLEKSEPDSGGLTDQRVRTTPRRADSVFSSLLPFIESAFGGLGADDSPMTSDNALEEARRILVREVRSKAPLAGSFTLVKLRRARTREELVALFDEVDSHISKPMRHLSARQTLLHVQHLLTGDAVGEPNSLA